jgi:hypothetical protein
MSRVNILGRNLDFNAEFTGELASPCATFCWALLNPVFNILNTNPSQVPHQIAQMSLFNKSPESTDSARVAHSRDSPVVRPVESDLPAPF